MDIDYESQMDSFGYGPQVLKKWSWVTGSAKLFVFL